VMPRTRSLKPSYFTDAELTLFPPLHRIAFEGLWVWADKRGLLEDKPRELKVQILPFDNVDFDAILTDLCRPKSDGSPGFIRRYQVNGRRFIHIRKFLSHQKPHIKETIFEHVPPPPEETPDEPGLNPGQPSAQPGPALGQSAGSLVLGIGSGNGSLVLGAGVAPPPNPIAAMSGIQAPPSIAQGAHPERRASPGADIEFFAWSQERRSAARPGLIPEAPPSTYAAWFRNAAEAVSGDVDRLRNAWLWWLKDDWGASRNPPFAMRCFQSDEVWRKHVPEVSQQTQGPPKASKLNRAPAPDLDPEELEELRRAF
jgi:hypothetical protein